MLDYLRQTPEVTDSYMYEICSGIAPNLTEGLVSWLSVLDDLQCNVCHLSLSTREISQHRM